MEGWYYYDIQKKEWHWHIDYMNVEVASGTCKHRGLMNEVLEKHGFVSWNKAY